eukprot:1202688-Prymnesium_polylepis.1
MSLGPGVVGIRLQNAHAVALVEVEVVHVHGRIREHLAVGHHQRHVRADDVMADVGGRLVLVRLERVPPRRVPLVPLIDAKRADLLHVPGAARGAKRAFAPDLAVIEASPARATR